MPGDPGYKFTVFYTSAGFGASESWYTGDRTISQAVALINKYMSLRSLMLPTRVEFAGVRVGRTQLNAVPGPGIDNLRQSQFYDAGSHRFEGENALTLIVPETGAFVPKEPEGSGPFANVSLHMRAVFDTARSTTRYLIWPAGVVVGPDRSGLKFEDVDWQKLLIRLENFVAGAPTGQDTPNQLYIKGTVGSDSSNTFPILRWSYQTAAPGIIGFTLPSSQAGGMTVGSKIHIRNTRRKAPATFSGAIKLGSLNGKWIVDSVAVDTPVANLTTIYLRGTEGFDPTTLKLLGTAQLVQYRLFPVLQYKALRVRTHKRGKDSTVPRGRRLTRVSADP